MGESSSNPLELAATNKERFPLPLPSTTSENSEAVEAAGQGIWEDYEIIDKLGSGGMGTVWRARLCSGGREVALKQLNAGLETSEAARRRFQREVEITSLLEHPNIARVYESGVHHDAYFYTMELIDGVSIDACVQRNLLDHRKCLELMCVVCRAMHYAHRKGVIHRDLKPSNILVDREGNPHVVDFGMGKHLDEEKPFSTISMQGEWVGTPAYMSPEQAAGLNEQISEHSDIYSLGVILYQLTTKRLPHDPIGGNAAIMDRIARSDIVQPRQACPSIDVDTETILLKSLAKRPEERYATAGEMADDIDRCLQGDPLKARPPTIVYLLRKRIVKHRVAIILTVSMAALLSGIISTSEMRVNRARRQAFAETSNSEVIRHNGSLNLVNSTSLDAESMANEGRLDEARQRYLEAYRIEIAEALPTIKTRLRLLDAIRHAPFELTSFFGNTDAFAPPIDTIFDPDERLALVELADGVAQSYDLLTGRAGTAIGEKVSNGEIQGVFDSPDQNFIYRLNSGVISQVNAFSEIQKVDLRSGSAETTLKVNAWLSSDAAISPDGHSIVAIGWHSYSYERARPWGLWFADSTFAADPQMLTKDSEEIRAVSRSSDLRTIVAGDKTGAIRSWDAISRVESHVADIGHDLHIGIAPEGITCLKFAPDDGGLLVSDTRGNVRFITMSVKKQSRNFTPSSARVVVLGFSHDGRTAFSGDVKGELHLWNVGTGELTQVFSAGSAILSARISFDDRMILVRAKDNSIHVWPIDDDGQSVLCQSPDPIDCIAISPDNLIAAVGASDGLEIIDIATGNRLWHTSGLKNVMSATFQSSGTLLEVATADGAISRFEVFGQWRESSGCTPGTMLQVLTDVPSPSPADRAFAVLLSPTSDLAIALSQKGAIMVNVAKGERSRTITGSYLPIGCVSSDGQTVYAIATRPTPAIVSINLRSGVVSNVSMHKEIHVHCTAIDISPDSRTVFLGYDDGTIHAIDWHSEADKWSIACGGQVAKFLKLSPDGTVLLSVGDNGAMKLWNVNDQTELKYPAQNSSALGIAGFSPQSDMILFSRLGDNALCMLDTGLPKRLSDMEGQISESRKQIVINPTSVSACAKLISWFEMQGALDWANHMLDDEDNDSNFGIGAARDRWRMAKFAVAAKDFDYLIQRGGSGFSLAYLKSCRDAAARGE